MQHLYKSPGFVCKPGDFVYSSGIASVPYLLLVQNHKKIDMKKTEVITRISRLVLLSLLIAAPIFLFGQNNRKMLTQTVRGTVVDAASGYPIAYASVALLRKPGMGAISDSLGRFVIKNVPIGRHDVQASYIGYESSIFKEVLVTSSK